MIKFYLRATIFFFIALPNPTLKVGPTCFYTSSLGVPSLETRLNILA